MKGESDLKRTNLTLPTDTREWLAKIGQGNISKGIRILHIRYKKTEYPAGRPPKNSIAIS